MEKERNTALAEKVALQQQMGMDPDAYLQTQGIDDVPAVLDEPPAVIPKTPAVLDEPPAVIPETPAIPNPPVIPPPDFTDAQAIYYEATPVFTNDQGIFYQATPVFAAHVPTDEVLQAHAHQFLLPQDNPFTLYPSSMSEQEMAELL